MTHAAPRLLLFALAAAAGCAALAAGTAPPAAAAPPADPCARLVDGRARLDCHDQAARAARAAATPPQAPSPLSGVCTPDSPCVDHRGGVYYVTPSGLRRYPPRG